jgi:polyhydroxyalkanoate synthesis regulator phasin
MCTLNAVPHDDLIDHLVAATGVSPAEAARLVSDVVAYFAEPTEQLVRRRHRELRERGLKNTEIFGVIRGELARRVVAPPDLTERQVRRIVYG